MNQQEHDTKEVGPEIHVFDGNTMRPVKFHSPWESTLQSVWDQAYIELKEARRPKDELQCEKEGVPMTQYLALTLRQLQDQHICPDRHFQIMGPSGGACHG